MKKRLAIAAVVTSAFVFTGCSSWERDMKSWESDMGGGLNRTIRKSSCCTLLSARLLIAQLGYI